MATVEAETSHDEQVPPGGSVYDGFISYSHAADDLLAPRLQAGLQRFAKPWWKRRALRIFRDEASLSANPHLWSSITEALDQSAWFVLLLSPEAAESPWVNNEVEYWLEHKDPGRIIPVLTDGDFGWGPADVTGDAVPPALESAFVDEPRWVDLRFARTEEQLDLKNPTFSAAIADIASPIRGVPKDELESEEVRQHRRTVRTAWMAGFALLVLVVIATGAAIFALGEQNRANDEADRANELAQLEADARSEAEEQQAAAEAAATQARAEALASQAIVELERDPELSVLLALEALETDVQPSAVSALHAALQRNRTLYTHATDELHNASMSPDGSLLAVWFIDERVELWDTESGELRWTTQLDSSRLPRQNPRGVEFTEDGFQVVVLDTTRFASYTSGEGLVFLDVTDGSVMRRVDPGDCIMTVEPAGPRFVDPAGKLPALWGTVNEAGGDPVCNITSHRAGYIDLATGERTVVTDVLGSIALIGAPTMTRDGRLFAVGVGSPVVVYDLITDELVREFDVPGISTISADGSRILVGQSPLELRSVDDGSLLTVYQGNLSDAWFGPDESFIYAADFDGSVKLFDTASGALLSEFRGSQTRSANALLSVDGNSLFTDEGGRISRISNVRAGPLTENPAFELDLPTGSVVVPSGGLQLSDPLTHIPYSPGDGLYYQIVDSVGRLVRQSGSVGWSAMSPDGRYVAELPIVPGKQTRDGTPGELVERLQLVDARTGDVVLIFADTCEFVFNLETSSGEPSEACPNPLEPSDLVFSADGSTLAVRGWAWNAAVFDVVTGERLWTSGPAQYDLPSIQAAIGVSPRGDTVVTSVRIGASNDRYHFVDVATSEVLGVLTLDQVQEAPIQIVYSSTGSHVFVVDAAANLLVIDTDPWNLVSTLSRAQGGHLSDVALSPDDRLATTVGIDGVVRVWDWESETLVQEIDLGTSLTQVEFIDADHLLVVSRGGDVVVLTLDVLELAGIGRDRVTRKFSAIECATYRIDVCPSRADNASGSG